MMTIAIYARVSRSDGTQDAANQLEQLRRYARKQDWLVYGEYVDTKTGSTAERDAFKELFADAHEREFDLVLFWSLDRFSREGALKTLQHLQRLTDYGVKWKSLTQEYLDSSGPLADAVIAIMACLAKQEREILRQRTKAGLERARRKGKQLGRPRKVFGRERVHIMRKQGQSYREIGQAVGISAMHCYRICTGKV
jgi:DNA invertase Pin-like site-specific DNA recombinase